MAITDKFTHVGAPGTITSLQSPGKAIAASSINIGSASNWPTDTAVYFAIRSINANLVSSTNPSGTVPGTYTEWKGTLTGTTISSLSLQSGTDQVYTAGSNTQVFITIVAARENALVDGMLVQHNQDGTHKAITTDSITVSTSATLPANSVTATTVSVGMPVQIVSTNYSTVATGTATIPLDDTPPQITEGTEFMTQVITPKSATNRLNIEVKMYGSHSAITDFIAALFQDAGVNALAANAFYAATGTGEGNLTITHDMVAGTTSATTFRVRAGGSTAGTFTFNGRSSGRNFGGITLSNIKITEYKA